VPQPGVVDIGALGDVAAQLDRQIGDQHRITLVRPVSGQVLTYAFAMDQQRLDTHKLQAEPVALLGHDLPPVPGRLTRDHRVVEPRGAGPFAGPPQHRRQIPRTAEHGTAGQHNPVVVDHHDLLDPVGQIDPRDRAIVRDQLTKPTAPIVTAHIAPGQLLVVTVVHDILPVAGTPSPNIPGRMSHFNHYGSY
jgi:hypothetical protein